MKYSMLFAVALFFAQSNLCLAAAPAVLTQDRAFPIRQDIRELVANSPFFSLPTGDYIPFGTHSVKPGGSTPTDVPTDNKTSLSRVAGSPLCRSSLDLITGKRSDWILKTETLSWAGLINLSNRTSDLNPYAQKTTTLQVTRLDNLNGQPFPLKTGNTFSLEATYERVASSKTPDNKQKVETSALVMQTTCQVGATGPAAVIQAGLKGSATALACTVTPQGSLTGTPISYHWLDSVGCFVRTPKP